jgi:hypothetical protein
MKEKTRCAAQTCIGRGSKLSTRKQNLYGKEEKEGKEGKGKEAPLSSRFSG